MTEPPLLSVEEMRFGGGATATFTLRAGGSLALLGGRRASELALAPLRLTRPSSGRIVFAGRDLVSLRERQLRGIRGEEIGAVFADPAGSLHPSYRLGWQLTEAVLAHHDVSNAVARDRAVDALEAVGVPEPRRTIHAHARELEVEVRLRAVIAIALINRPALLLVDDPFASLDPDARRSIVELLAGLRRRLGFALLLATADETLAAQLADEVYLPSEADSDSDPASTSASDASSSSSSSST